MKQLIIDKLVEIGIFNRKSISEDDFNNHKDSNGGLVYSKSEHEWDNGNIQKFFWQTDTQNLTDEEINLLLNIDKANSLRSIKKGVTFFVVLSVISITISIISAVSVASLF